MAHEGTACNSGHRKARVLKFCMGQTQEMNVRRERVRKLQKLGERSERKREADKIKTAMT